MRHLPGGVGKRHYPGRTWGMRAEQERVRNKVRVVGKALREGKTTTQVGRRLWHLGSQGQCEGGRWTLKALRTCVDSCWKPKCH